MTRFEINGRPDAWRRVAMATWNDMADASIYGWLDIDATEITRYLAELRRVTGARVTITHAVGKAVALAFAESAVCNAFPTYGRLKQRETVDVFFSVAEAGGKGLSGAKVERADELALDAIASELDRGVRRIRGDGDSDLQKSQKALRRMPALLLKPMLRGVAAAMYDLNLDLSRFGVPFDPFGTAIVTNVGTLGLEQGFGPLMPTGRVAGLFTVGAIRDKVVPFEGRPTVRPVLTIGGTFDHRVVDGYHLGKIARALRAALEDPTAHFGALRRSRATPAA